MAKESVSVKADEHNLLLTKYSKHFFENFATCTTFINLYCWKEIIFGVLSLRSSNFIKIISSISKLYYDELQFNT